MRRILSICMAFFLILSLISPGASAEERVLSGPCGGNTRWDYNEESHTLTISGSGRMAAYEQWENPFRHLNGEILHVIVRGSVSHVGDFAFFRLFKVQTITLEEGITSLGRNSLQNTCITSIDLPDSVRKMGMVCLGSSWGLQSVELPESLESIPELLFGDCSGLTHVRVGKNLREVQSRGFAGLNAAHLFFTGDAPTFAQDAFDFSSGVTIHYPAGASGWDAVKDRDYGSTSTLVWKSYDPAAPDAFRAEDAVNFSYSSGHTELTVHGKGPMRTYVAHGPWLTHRNTVVRATLKDGVQSVGSYAFGLMDSLQEVVLPESVTEIGFRAFNECRMLQKINLPEGLTFIAGCAFSGCRRLTSLTFTGSAPDLADNAFEGVTATISYPEGDPSWEACIGQNFGGKIAWRAYETEASRADKALCAEISAASGAFTLPAARLSANALSAAAGRDVTLTYRADDYAWEIHGEDITDPTAIDLSLTLVEENLRPAEAESLPSLVFSIAHSGSLGCTAGLTLPLGEEFSGYAATLWHLPEEGEPEQMGNAEVSAAGDIAFSFTHASLYRLELTPPPEPPAPAGGSRLPVILAAAAGLLALAVLFLILRRKKKA